MNSKLKQLVVTLLIIFLTFSPFLMFSVYADPSPSPAAYIKVSLPEGTYIGYDPDPWLSECWLLNLTGASQTFTVRVNNTNAAKRSYDTHVIIALSDAGYNNLETLVVNGTTVPKSAFRYGTPTPYNLWTWPSGDVYPAWFNDTIVNIGTVPRKVFIDLMVSVTFSDATGVRMHFDAYGSKVSPPPPTKDGDITHNSLSHDSTVLLQPGPPPPQPPFASFFYNPYYPETYEMVTFNASESYDPDGYIVSYTWDFGDETPIVVENDPITNHTYTTFGDYTVKLTVTDNSSLTDEATATIHVSQPPVASFTFSPPDPLEHEIVSFDASTSTPDGGTLVSYEWDFGDGTPHVIESDPTTTHVYATYGTYVVTLNVTDSEGKWDTESKPITVEALPIAEFTWSPYYPQVGENVTFDASDSTPDGGIIISYTWDFGDSTPTTIESDPITNHTYTAHGDYTVTLNITDSEGRWDTESKIITVKVPTYVLTVTTTTGGTTDPSPGTYTYNAGTNVPVQALPSANYMFDHWVLDGSPAGSVNPISVLMDGDHTLEAVFAQITYQLTITTTTGGTTDPSLGTYTYASGSSVEVTAIPDADYVFDHWELDTVNVGSDNPYSVLMDADHTLHAVFTYSPPPPPLSASISPTSATVYTGGSVTFTSTVSGGVPPYTYQWYFDDSPVSDATSSSWTYTPTSARIHYVHVKVTDSAGNSFQSDPATVVVASIPVGGYSVSLTEPTKTIPLVFYTMILVISGAVITLIKRKRK